ncbi:MAG: hypothetical protein JWO93_571, partial [Micrococcaceae bacterium]|nr:hypothetical protein [Micrococcaceae bacterium]
MNVPVSRASTISVASKVSTALLIAALAAGALSLNPAAATAAEPDAPTTQTTPKDSTSSSEPVAAKPADAGAVMGSAGKQSPNSGGAAALTPDGGRIPAGTTSPSAVGTEALTSPSAIQPDGTSGMPLGMDVSGWQGNVNWQAAWNNGARFAYIKASEGPWALNDFFDQQYNGSASVGMLRGAYSFARPNLSSGANQAQVLVESGGSWNADGKTLPGVLDLEKNTLDGSGACFGLSPAQLVTWTRDFTTKYKALTGRNAVIYTAYYFWQDCLGGTTAFNSTNPLWIAAYGAGADNVWMPGGWPRYTFWQYADSGTFVGDQNVFNGSYTALKALASNGASAVTAPIVSPYASYFKYANMDAIYGKRDDGSFKALDWQEYSSLGTPAFAT